MRRPLLLLMLVLGLVAASVVAIALRPAVLGLDLQGGVEVVLQGKATEQSPVNKEAIDRSVEIIRNRVDAFGVSEPEIQTQGSDQIVVALPGADDPERVVDDLIQPAKLLFINYEQNLASPQGFATEYEALKWAQGQTPKDVRSGAQPGFYAFTKGSHAYIAGPEIDRETLRDSLPSRYTLENVDVEELPRGFFLATSPGIDPDSRIREWVVFQDHPAVTGPDVESAQAVFQRTGLGGSEWVVQLNFTGEGGRKFADATRELAQDGNIQGRSMPFAILLDGEIISTPTVDYERYPAGLGSGGAIIEGLSQGEAETLGKQINSGALPIDLEVISQKQVSATLGKESLRQGLIAGLSGLVLVILFLVGYYRFLGLIAAAGLVVYGVLLWAVAVLVPITLTLPGIAGIILTIGVASDANVVIFERVREEARSGKPPRAAVLSGYKKGISAIIDANVVTLATAAILFLFSTAGVKGFAFTLFIGVLLSLFTAVIATRAVFNVLADTKVMQDDRLMGLRQREIRWKFDFVGYWKLWMAISFIPLVVGAVWIGVKGLNLGLDFESGTRITAAFEQQQPSEDQVREVFAGLGYADATIQATTENVDGREVRGFQMQTETLQPAQQSELQRALEQRFGNLDRESVQIESVGPTFGAQVIRNAVYAILLSFIVIILYLTIRFEYKLALPALLTVVHDVWLAIAVYSITGREVTSETVAALLTILGYSLYDVVIVFDRIRENVPIMRKATYRQVVNTSTHEVLTRSLITSMTTLIPILALFFFGGETLKDFAFALFVGILTGGVSSIAIAAPLAAIWKEREPENRRRAAKVRRQQARVATDADVADLDVLARAEAALAAEEARERGDDYEPEGFGGEQRAIGAGGSAAAVATSQEPPPDGSDAHEGGELPGEEPPGEEPPADEPPAEDGGVGATPDGPEPAPSGGEADDGEAKAPRQRRPRADPNRVRRHRNVQRKRR
ncbi:MAG: protein translocase subunit SecD [Thermoleophilia bacterium]